MKLTSLNIDEYKNIQQGGLFFQTKFNGIGRRKRLWEQ